MMENIGYFDILYASCVDKLFSMNMLRIDRRTTHEYLCCKGKNRPQNQHWNLCDICILFFMINMIIQCVLQHVANGSVSPVQSNVKCSKWLKFKFALLARCISFDLHLVKFLFLSKYLKLDCTLITCKSGDLPVFCLFHFVLCSNFLL